MNRKHKRRKAAGGTEQKRQGGRLQQFNKNHQVDGGVVPGLSEQRMQRRKRKIRKEKGEKKEKRMEGKEGVGGRLERWQGGRRGTERGTNFPELKVTNLQTESSFQVFRMYEKKNTKNKNHPQNTRMEKKTLKA